MLVETYMDQKKQFRIMLNSIMHQREWYTKRKTYRFKHPFNEKGNPLVRKIKFGNLAVQDYKLIREIYFIRRVKLIRLIRIWRQIFLVLSSYRQIYFLLSFYIVFRR
jgi:hypothetical protein